MVSEDPFKGLAFSPESNPRTRSRWCKFLAAPFGHSLHPNSWCLPGATPRCVYRTGAPPNPPVTNREKKRAHRSVQTSHLKYLALGVISPEILSWPFNKLQRSRLPVPHTNLSTSDLRVRKKQTHCVPCSLAEDWFFKNAPNQGLPGGPVIKSPPANAVVGRGWVWSLVWELRSHILWSNGAHASHYWAWAPQLGNSPQVLQLEKAPAQQQRPSAARYK